MSHEIQLRVYYEDTDAGGVVYHASYLRFAERARTEWLRDVGFTHADLLRQHGLSIVVHALAARFRRPAKLDDILRISTNLVEIKGARVNLVQAIERSAELVAAMDVELAAITPDGRPTRLPHPVRSQLASRTARALGA